MSIWIRSASPVFLPSIISSCPSSLVLLLFFLSSLFLKMHISGDDSEPSEDGNLRNLGKARPKEPQTPLPWFQLFVVLLIQFAEPITATVIYPFAPAFVRRTGITGGDEKKTGYFAGIIVSENCNLCFSFRVDNRYVSLLSRNPPSLLRNA